MNKNIFEGNLKEAIDFLGIVFITFPLIIVGVNFLPLIGDKVAQAFFVLSFVGVDFYIGYLGLRMIYLSEKGEKKK